MYQKMTEIKIYLNTNIIKRKNIEFFYWSGLLPIFFSSLDFYKLFSNHKNILNLQFWHKSFFKFFILSHLIFFLKSTIRNYTSKQKNQIKIQINLNFFIFFYLHTRTVNNPAPMHWTCIYQIFKCKFRVISLFSLFFALLHNLCSLKAGRSSSPPICCEHKKPEECRPTHGTHCLLYVTDVLQLGLLYRGQIFFESGRIYSVYCKL